MCANLFRPPDIVVGGLIFYCNSFFLFRQLHSELAERNSTKIGQWSHGRKWVQFENACPKSGVSPPLQIGGPKTPLSTILQLNAKFNGLYLRNETWNRQSGKCSWQLQGVSYIVSKRHELWSTNSFKLDHHFYPPYVNYAFYVIARLRRQTSANKTQPNFVTRRVENRGNNML